MNARILVNGREIKDALAIVDTLNNKASLETVFTGEKILDKVYVEVRIFGDIRPYRMDSF